MRILECLETSSARGCVGKITVVPSVGGGGCQTVGSDSVKPIYCCCRVSISSRHWLVLTAVPWDQRNGLSYVRTASWKN